MDYDYLEEAVKKGVTKALADILATAALAAFDEFDRMSHTNEEAAAFKLLNWLADGATKQAAEEE